MTKTCFGYVRRSHRRQREVHIVLVCVCVCKCLRVCGANTDALSAPWRMRTEPHTSSIAVGVHLPPIRRTDVMLAPRARRVRGRRISLNRPHNVLVANL